MEDFTSKLGLMKCTEAADDVKLEGRYLIIPFITQCKDNPKHKSVIKDSVRTTKKVLYF